MLKPGELNKGQDDSLSLRWIELSLAAKPMMLDFEETTLFATEANGKFGLNFLVLALFLIIKYLSILAFLGFLGHLEKVAM